MSPSSTVGNPHHHELFPTDLPERQWQTFDAQGYAQPVVGVIYRNGGGVPYTGFSNPEVTASHIAHWPLIRECGVPLGGIGTGYVTLRLDGRLGGWSLYNNLANPDTGAKLNWWTTPVPQTRNVDLPFLGLALGDKSYVLCLNAPDGVKGAQQIHYWGHYPVADLEYELGAPIRIGLRAWTPFIPGDSVKSNIPGAVFELRLRNTSNRAQRGTVAFSFPGPDEDETRGASDVQREDVTSPFRGVAVTAWSGGWPGPDPDAKFPGGYPVSENWVPNGYALGVLNADNVRAGGPLRDNGWANIAETLPQPQRGDLGSSVAADITLNPGETKTVRFVLSWYAPYWPKTRTINMYHTHFRSPLEVAQHLANEHSSLLANVLAWQGEIYSEETLPDYLRDALVNILHLITKDSSYIRLPGADPRDGLLTLVEAARTMPLREVICQAVWGDFAITYFFPELRRGTLRAIAAYQLDDGRIPLQLGINEHDMPAYAHPLVNGFLFTEMVDRLWQRTGDDGVVREFYPTIKRAMRFHMTQSVYDDGLVSYDPITAPRGQPYDSWDWRGNASYTAGHWLCALRVAERMAEHLGDKTFAETCRDWIYRGSRAMEETLWNADAQSYYTYNAPGTEYRSDTVFSYQLEGSFSCALLGLPEVFPADRLNAVLDTIERLCVKPIAVGAANSMRPDGSIDSSGSVDSEGIFPSHNALLSAEFAYQGRPEAAAEIMEQMLRNLVLEHLFAWDFPQGFFKTDGAVPRACDDYFGMAIWAVPPALFGQDIREFCAPGGFAHRIIQAGNKEDSASESCE
ncbi:MAG: GH116 family glycosyl hydrolase [Candidatus Poribacteria bacterium]|nr:GH116 family glycosyl hydrolase [Candidatus Poribacteria bacterium]